MLYTETIGPLAFELLKRLSRLPEMEGFFLVGGTALALQLGHRISVDLDFFTDVPFDEMELSRFLKSEFGFETDFLSHHTIKGEIKGVKVDCIAHQYPWIGPAVQEDEIRLAGLADLSAMKLNAISNDGSRMKDFIDVACLSEKLSLNSMLDAYSKKYGNNIIIPLKALNYYADINFNEPVRMVSGGKPDWKRINRRLKAIQNSPDQLFTRLI